MKVLVLMSNLLAVFFVLCSGVISAKAATYENEFVLAPKYIAENAPFVTKYKIIGLSQNTSYYIKGRFYRTSTSGYSGNTYNQETGKWLKQSDAWTAHPVITSGEDGLAEGSLILKLPGAVSGAYNLQLAIRKEGSSTNDSLGSEVLIEVLDTTDGGNGGFVYGYAPSASNNLLAASISNNETNSCYLTEINNIDDGYEDTAGFFQLPIPAQNNQKIVIYSEGSIYAASEDINILPGESKLIELQELQPLNIEIIHPENNAILSFLNRETLSVSFSLKGGIAPYAINFSLKDKEGNTIIDSRTENYSSNGEKNVFFSLAQANSVFELAIEVVDSVGNKQTAKTEFLADSNPPEKPKLIGNLKFINKNNTKSFLFQGFSEPGSFNFLTITDKNGSSVVTSDLQSNEDGKFQTIEDLALFSDGYIYIKIESFDEAGNSSAVAKYKLYKDTVPPIINNLKLTKIPSKKPVFINFSFQVAEKPTKKVYIEIIATRKNLRKFKYWSGSVIANKTVVKRIKTKNDLKKIDIKVKDVAGNVTIKKLL